MSMLNPFRFPRPIESRSAFTDREADVFGRAEGRDGSFRLRAATAAAAARTLGAWKRYESFDIFVVSSSGRLTHSEACWTWNARARHGTCRQRPHDGQHAKDWQEAGLGARQRSGWSWLQRHDAGQSGRWPLSHLHKKYPSKRCANPLIPGSGFPPFVYVM